MGKCGFIVKCPLEQTQPIRHSAQSKHRLQAQDTQKCRKLFFFYKVYMVCSEEITTEFFIAKDDKMEDVVGT